MYIIRFLSPQDSDYSLVKIAVQKHYFNYFGAMPNPNPDYFICLIKSDDSSDIIACAGITCASSGKLFSEHYLDQSLDKIYSVNRNRILEVSCFSAFYPGIGAGQTLLKNIMHIFASRNYLYIVLTATRKVQQILQSIQDNIDYLSIADPTRVEDITIDWGTYYDSNPRVVVSKLNSSNEFASFDKLLQSFSADKAASNHLLVL
ncbi:thermostable hemolysin [Psychrobacter faecalis]|uniref:thermostable hemolysin n=1 Tax=Psychrobacter faecalis TaxID=180588 RepID=UPI003FCF569C